MSARQESELVKRGRALPQGRELIYLSKPTPTTQRWVFQGSGPVLLTYTEALGHILSVEAASVLCTESTGRTAFEDGGRVVLCNDCDHRWDWSTRQHWGSEFGVGHLPRHYRPMRETS